MRHSSGGLTALDSGRLDKIMAFSQTELEDRRRTQQAHMPMLAVHEVYTPTQNTVGELDPGYVDGQTYACGYDRTGNTKVEAEAGELVVADVLLRIPTTAQAIITPRDRLRVEVVYGDVLAEPLIYEVMGYAVSSQGTAILLPCREVTHGTN